MLKFQNKVALITGSGTGIGMTVAKKFVENGASVIILGRRKEPLEDTSKMLNQIINEKQTNGFVKIFSGVDVSDEKAITEMFDALQNENISVDIVVNNAGVSGPVTCFTHAPLEDTSKMLNEIINEKQTNGFVKIFSGVDAVSYTHLTLPTTPYV